jgi:hypothetical protein
MTEKDLYNQAHLFVAAIRVLTHQKSAPPAMQNVCDLLDCSLEHGHWVSRRLTALEIIEAVQGAYGTRLFIKDHRKLEEIAQTPTENKLDEALREFQASRQDQSQKVAAVQAEQKAKQKNLFADLEKQLKKDLAPK